MIVTQIDLDDEALNEAMRMMGTSTKKETVNTALREYVARVKRIEALEKLASRAQRGSSTRRRRPGTPPRPHGSRP